MSARPRSPLPRAALAQVSGLAVAAGVAAVGAGVDWSLLVWLAGAVAALAGVALGLPLWWAPLQLLFPPLVRAAQGLELDPRLYLLAFVLCLLVLGNSLRDRVPLYLSSRRVWEQVAGLIPAVPGQRFADLGCGTGGGLARLAALRPDVECVGVESSPLLWLFCRLRLRGRRNCRVLFADLWRVDLGAMDVVYAFLSPAPMSALWEKAKGEMRPGSLFISNSFQVPEATPSAVIEVDDRRRSRLYVWRL